MLSTAIMIIFYFAYLKSKKVSFISAFVFSFLLNFNLSSNIEIQDFIKYSIIKHPTDFLDMKNDYKNMFAHHKSSGIFLNNKKSFLSLDKPKNICQYFTKRKNDNPGNRYYLFNYKDIYNFYFASHRLHDLKNGYADINKDFAFPNLLFKNLNNLKYLEKSNIFWLPSLQSSYFYSFIINDNFKKYTKNSHINNMNLKSSYYFEVQSIKNYFCKKS